MSRQAEDKKRRDAAKVPKDAPGVLVLYLSDEKETATYGEANAILFEPDGLRQPGDPLMPFSTYAPLKGGEPTPTSRGTFIAPMRLVTAREAVRGTKADFDEAMNRAYQPVFDRLPAVALSDLAIQGMERDVPPELGAERKVL